MSSKIKMFTATLATVFSASAFGAVPLPDLNPGKWELSMQITEPSVTPVSRMVVCITTDSLTRIAAPVMRSGDGCTVGSLSFTSRSLSYVTTCPSINRRTTTTLTFGGDDYTITQVLSEPDQTVKQVITGKRVGTCE